MKGKLLKFKLCSLFLLFICKAAFGETNTNINYKLSIQYRTTPGAKNILGTVAYDGLLWGQAHQEKPLYGYYKLGLVAGGAPTVGAFAEVAPIAPLVFRLQKSATYRYLKSSVFECRDIYCYGVVDRTDATVSLAAGYEKIIGVMSYLWREIRTPASSQPVLIEQENFITTPGSHNFNEMTFFSGYKLTENKLLGLHYAVAEFSEGHRRLNTIYGIYQWKWSGQLDGFWDDIWKDNHSKLNQNKDQGFDLTAGIGSYETDQAYVSGIGIIFSIGKKFGESLSLF